MSTAFDFLNLKYQNTVKKFCERFSSNKVFFSSDGPLSLVGHPTDISYDGSTYCKSITVHPGSTEYTLETMKGQIIEGDLCYEDYFNIENLTDSINDYMVSYNYYEKLVKRFYKRFPSGILFESYGFMFEDYDNEYKLIDLNHGNLMVRCKTMDNCSEEIPLSDLVMCELGEEIESKLEEYGKVSPKKKGK